jgi:hypothetical protein
MKVQATISGRAVRGRLPRVSGTLAAAGVLGALLAGCGGAGSPSAAVPSIGHGGGAQAAGSGQSAKLHAAAQCIRQHGIPGYADPVLTSSGAVYSDARSFQNAAQSALNAVRAACGTLMTEAGLSDPESEPPAPPQLVEAGVRAAQCERAHGLPNVTDPTANSPYTPGHGFGFTGEEVPAGGKASHGFQEALHACRSLADAEIRASTLTNLGSDG